MFLYFLFSICVVKYQSKGKELIISGDGIVTMKGVRDNSIFTEIEIVTIKEGITEVGQFSFDSCYYLKSISFPSTVTKITDPFFRTKRLVTITVDSANQYYKTDSQGILYEIATKKIVRVPAKENIVIPEGPTLIGRYAFNVNHGFNFGKLVLPSTIKDLHGGAFNEMKAKEISFKENSDVTYFDGFSYSSFTKVIVPKGCLIIKKQCFWGCYIANLIFEKDSKLATIGEEAFRITEISTIILPESVETLEYRTFYNSDLKSIYIGKSCTNISITAFVGCQKLHTVNISSENQNYTSNGRLVMNKEGSEIIFIAQGEDTITIPDTVTKMGDTLLQSIPNLKNVIFNNNPKWTSFEGVVYSKDYHTLYFVCGGITEVNTKQEVQTINQYAACFCKNLKTFNIKGQSCTEIGHHAFYISGLNSFTLPDTVKTIGYYGFSECENLTEFVITKNSQLNTLMEYSFERTVLKTFYVPRLLATIRFRSFWFSKIETVTFDPEATLTKIPEKCFNGGEIKEFNFPSSVTGIDEFAFLSCENLKNINFKSDSKLATISERAFQYCTNLVKVALPNSCTTLKMQAFEGCSSLDTFTYMSLTTVESMCFKDCTSLKTFHIHPSLKEMSTNTFFGCIQLYSFSVSPDHETLKEQGGAVFQGTLLYLYPPGREEALISNITLNFRSNVFSGCLILRDVFFESGCRMQTFVTAAFYGCITLENIVFPPTLENIESECFYNCTSLKIIKLPAELITIGKNAFSCCKSLRIVKYCGTNIIEGIDIFPNTVKFVYVTKLYKSDFLCTIRVTPSLGLDCELVSFKKNECTKLIPNNFLFCTLLFND